MILIKYYLCILIAFKSTYNSNMKKLILTLLISTSLIGTSSALTFSSYKPHINMTKKEKKQFDHYVLKAQSDGNMVFTNRNVPNREGLYTFFDGIEDHMGVKEKGIEFNLKYSDVGVNDDWTRWGDPGFAQRFQIQEPLNETARRGQTKWYRLGYWLNKSYDSTYHALSTFDFKMIYGKSEKAVGSAWNITNKEFTWFINSDKYITKKGETGDEMYMFDSYAVVLDPFYKNLTGKWVFLIINAKWDKDGFIHLWIDGELRVSYYGDTIGGADRVRFKFGPYRNHMLKATKNGLKIPDAKIRYTGVGKADKCEDIWTGCSSLTEQLSVKSQVKEIHHIATTTFKSNPDTTNNSTMSNSLLCWMDECDDFHFEEHK